MWSKQKKPKLVDPLKKAHKIRANKRKCVSQLQNINKKSKIAECSRTVQSSSPQFCFFQIDEEWQISRCDQLGLEIISPNRASKGDGNTILTKPDMRCVKVMMGDGNCMFRALSFVLTGSQD